jgi:hypothetical protein
MKEQEQAAKAAAEAIPKKKTRAQQWEEEVCQRYLGRQVYEVHY